MQTKGRDPEISAVEVVHGALKSLDAATRQRVLASVYALLEIAPPLSSSPGRGSSGSETTSSRSTEAPTRLTSQGRPTSLGELMQDKSPGTNAQRIVLFAYHREKNEGTSRFARNDLRAYFARAREHPPANFDRDFVEAVRRGWIHEDGDDSYITSRGIEAVEAGFSGERKYTAGAAKGKGRARPRSSKRGRR